MSTPTPCLHSPHTASQDGCRQHLLPSKAGQSLPSPCLPATAAEPQGTAKENFLIGLPTEQLPPPQAGCLDPSPPSSTDLHDTAQRPHIRLWPMALSQQHFWGQVVGGPTYCPVEQSTRSVHALHPLTDSLPLLQALGFTLVLPTPFCSLWPPFIYKEPLTDSPLSSSRRSAAAALGELLGRACPRAEEEQSLCVPACAAGTAAGQAQ